MKRTRVKELFNQKDTFSQKEVEIYGWVRSNRSQAQFGFLNVNDGSFFESVQVVYDEKISNFLEISNFNNFCEILSPKILNVKILKDELPNIIFNTFNGFSKNFIYFLIKKLIEQKKWIFESDITPEYILFKDLNNILSSALSSKKYTHIFHIHVGFT